MEFEREEEGREKERGIRRGEREEVASRYDPDSKIDCEGPGSAHFWSRSFETTSTRVGN